MITRVQSLLGFIRKRMLPTYLTLIPSSILAILSMSLKQRVLIFAFQFILILICTYVMFRDYENEEKKLTKLLQVHFGKLMKGGPGDPGYAYSLTYVSLNRISDDENVRKRTVAWGYHFDYLVDKFKMEAEKLSKDLEKGIGFPDAFGNFQVLLSTLREIKEKFYEMVNEVKPNKDFTQDSSFQEIYKRLHKEYNEYMNNLRMFSIECEAQSGLKLDKNSIEPLKDLNRL